MSSFGRTILAAVVAAGLFGYIYFVETKKAPPAANSGDAPKREKVFAGLDKMKVTSLSLQKPGGEMIHAEKTGENWALVSPIEAAADEAAIGTILDALVGLETEDVVNESVTDFTPFGLAKPTVSVSVVAEGAAKPFEMDLGDSVPASFGLFARVPGKPRVFTVSSTLENTLVKSAFDLRDRSVVQVKKDEIQWLEAVDKGNVAFRIGRGVEGDDEWKIEKPLATRAARWTVDSFLGLIENLRMETIVTEKATTKDLQGYGLGPTARRVVVGLPGDRTTTLVLGKRTEDSKYYVREAATNLVATIPTALVDDLDKGLKNLRAARLLDVAAYEITALDVTAAGVTRTFTKSSSKDKDGAETVVWKSKTPVKDATQEKASDALFAIGGLEAAEFVDAPKALSVYGLDSPALRVTLRFEGGKKEDWFEVAVKDDAGYARRRDDEAILRLEKSKTEALIRSFTELGS